MKFIADFHIHSKYSRATSKDMDLEHLAQAAKFKGIDLLGCGDFTHHLWLEELKAKLKDNGNGIFEYKGASSVPSDETISCGVKFILTTEVSSIFTQDGKLRKIHNIIFAPSFEIVDKINQALGSYGNLSADGRPTLSLKAYNLVEIVLGISEDCLIVPSHIWTPWFSVFGANSGFDFLQECFKNYTKDIYALETGLSSDPAMNWRLSCLDKYTLISNSDSHSPHRVGREANVFDTQLDYYEIINVLKQKNKDKFLYTIEFFPQEGKYHYDGHRNCSICFSPKESLEHNNICPKCRKPITVGVMHRVEELADRPQNFVSNDTISFKHLVPLEEIIAQVRNKGSNSKAVETEYKEIIQKLGNEINVLLDVTEDKLLISISPKVANGIIRVRNGNLKIQPGYDGVYGKIEMFDEESKVDKQLTLF